MRVPKERLKILYETILKSALQCDGQGCTLFILVSNDTDSVACLKILTVSYLLKFIKYDRVFLKQTKFNM